MNLLTSIAGEHIAGIPIAVKLIGESDQQAIIRGEWDGQRITYPAPHFDFTDYGKKITGFEVRIGDTVIHARDFPRPFVTGGPGDWIEIQLSGKPK